MSGIAELIVGSLFVFLVPASFLLSGICVVRVFKKQSLLPWFERTQVPWTFIDMLVCGFLSILFAIGGQFLYVLVHSIDIDAELSAGEQLTATLYVAGGGLVGCLAVVAYLRFRTGATNLDLGLTTKFLSHDVLYGILAFVALIVPVLGIQFGLMKLFPNANKHPFVELLLEDPNPFFIVYVFVAAVIVAPLAEEFLFRVLLQGWFERLVSESVDDSWMSTYLESETPTETPSNSDVLFANESTLPAKTESNPYESPIVAVEMMRDEPVVSKQPFRLAWLPILLSSFVFAMAHIGHGTAPIALFFLALGLGYVYQRTHRIWPGVVVHALVNLIAVLQLQVLIDSS